MCYAASLPLLIASAKATTPTDAYDDKAHAVLLAAADSCCACSCYKASDYAAERAAGGRKPSVTGTTSADETVAVITVGGMPASKKYEVCQRQLGAYAQWNLPWYGASA